MKTQDLIGRVFGQRTVIASARRSDGARVWTVRCSCGSVDTVSTGTLNAGRSSSCRACSDAAKRRTQGGATSPEHSSWASMITRCYNQKHVSYHNYGGRGITVCERWRHDFAAFYEDMGPRPTGTSIDRINNDGNYEPDNCRWATAAEQARNAWHGKRVTIDGETRNLTEWAAVAGIPVRSFKRYLSQGVSIEKMVRSGIERRRKSSIRADVEEKRGAA